PDQAATVTAFLHAMATAVDDTQEIGDDSEGTGTDHPGTADEPDLQDARAAEGALTAGSVLLGRCAGGGRRAPAGRPGGAAGPRNSAAVGAQ
ncbi:hypothetical protein, partial [Kocuria sabuli]|uniref:hypothetical protein n=1 Tax=Kocuria sabuli TaxID=3071448 RepID=UPI0034D3EF4E